MMLRGFPRLRPANPKSGRWRSCLATGTGLMFGWLKVLPQFAGFSQSSLLVSSKLGSVEN